ncbi:hypothetical protein [Streptomyces sp. NPDC001781]
MDDKRLRAVIREEIRLAVKTLDDAAEWTEADEDALAAIRRTVQTFRNRYAADCEAADAERAENPFEETAPDPTMSREVADFVLRAMNGLLLEGYWPKAYAVNGRHGGEDGREYDNALLLRAADIVGRDKIENAELRRLIAEAETTAADE